MPLTKFVVRSTIHGLISPNSPHAEQVNRETGLATNERGHQHTVHRKGDIVQLDESDPAVAVLIRPGVLERLEEVREQVGQVRDPNAEAQNEAQARADAQNTATENGAAAADLPAKVAAPPSNNTPKK